jgi:hypothetical protein
MRTRGPNGEEKEKVRLTKTWDLEARECKNNMISSQMEEGTHGTYEE